MPGKVKVTYEIASGLSVVGSYILEGQLLSSRPYQDLGNLLYASPLASVLG
jgi:hypothetical protein